MHEIPGLEAKIRECQEKIKTYSTLKINLNSAVVYLSSGAEHLVNATNSLEANYKIDDSGADKGDITKINTDVNNTKNYLSNNVIPAIDSEITNLNNTISSLSNRINQIREEERRRQEEEAAAAAAAAAAAKK